MRSGKDIFRTEPPPLSDYSINPTPFRFVAWGISRLTHTPFTTTSNRVNGKCSDEQLEKMVNHSIDDLRVVHIPRDNGKSPLRLRLKLAP